MIALPVFEAIRVVDYGLFPGTRTRPGLSVEFQTGLTLVLGANGLGKTTLVTLLHRMCTGPYDLPAGAGALGGRKVRLRTLPRNERRTFAARVLDGAASAHAVLTMSISGIQIEITRSLADLTLTSLRLQDEELPATEPAYQAALTELSGLPDFSDWLLLLRHVTFYFEDRRSLVWDPSAQRQILRLLFLPTELASEWTTLERAILEKDSRMRNLQNVLGKEEREVAAAESALSGAGKVQDELEVLQSLQAVDQPRLAALDDERAHCDTRRDDARLDVLRAELEHESAYRDLERRQLLAVVSVFPSGDETTAYLLAKLISDDDCLVCGHHVPTAAAAMRERLHEHQCAICGSVLSEETDVKLFSPRALQRASRALQRAEERLSVARAQRDSTEQEYDTLLLTVQELRATVSARTTQIEGLIARLPAGDAAMHGRREDLASMRTRVDVLRTELVEQRDDFSGFIGGVNRRVGRQRKAVEDAFAHFAAGFLLETAELAWHPHRARVGESGLLINYPAYELEMSGTNFNSPVRRTGPDQVSESQREFIDLAFRMTLMAVATEGGVGTLVIDAPESSLDAVFVERAADVLTRFATRDGNRLITTSNLVEGSLIPELIRLAGVTTDTDPRIVDLFRIAEPTAATRRLSSKYREVKRGLFARAQSK